MQYVQCAEAICVIYAEICCGCVLTFPLAFSLLTVQLSDVAAKKADRIVSVHAQKISALIMQVAH